MTAITSDRIRALADEAWSTADELVDTDPIALRELAYQQANALRAAADEVDRLRAVIDNAPHQYPCPHQTRAWLVGNCTCWKADAL